MKNILLLLSILSSALAYGKDLSFTPIGEDIPGISTGISGNVILSIVDVNEVTSDVLIKYKEILPQNKSLELSYRWSDLDGMQQLANNNAVLVGQDFTIYQLENNGGFKLESTTEELNVEASDIPLDFFQDSNAISFNELVVTSKFGDNLTGWLTRPYGYAGLSGFVWNKSAGFINPSTDCPTTCGYRIYTGDGVGKVLAGTYRYNPMFIDTSKSNELQVLDDLGYKYSQIIKLSDNGSYAIATYYDENLQTESSLVDTSDSSISLFPKLVTWDLFTGTKIWDSKMADVTDDGRMAVGTAGGHAVMWTPETGIRKIADVAASYGTDLQGWTLKTATHVSADGRYIFGEGRTAGDKPRIWRLELIRVCETPDW